jgi:hemerythrin-like metal-binding protein
MGNFFEWDAARFSLHVDDMDADHQAIIHGMNRLYELHSIGASRAHLVNAMAELMRVTIQHFADEEAYMRKIGFPDVVKHGLVHRNLLERMESFNAQFKGSGVLTEDFFAFLKMWLKAHICGIDMKYAAHAHAKAA